MSTGTRNKFTGQIGEHLVSAILGNMGYYTSPYWRLSGLHFSFEKF